MTEAENLAALAERANHNTPEGHKAYEMFCATVWNLYRAGRIAVIDDEAVEALRANKQGWENAIELDLLPSRHHDTARALIEQCTAAIAALEVK